MSYYTGQYQEGYDPQPDHGDPTASYAANPLEVSQSSSQPSYTGSSHGYPSQTQSSAYGGPTGPFQHTTTTSQNSQGVYGAAQTGQQQQQQYTGNQREYVDRYSDEPSSSLVQRTGGEANGPHPSDKPGWPGTSKLDKQRYAVAGTDNSREAYEKKLKDGWGSSCFDQPEAEGGS